VRRRNINNDKQSDITTLQLKQLLYFESVATCFGLGKTIIKLQCKACSVICGAALKYFPKFLYLSFIHVASELVSTAVRVLLLLLLLYYLSNRPCAR